MAQAHARPGISQPHPAIGYSVYGSQPVHSIGRDERTYDHHSSFQPITAILGLIAENQIQKILVSQLPHRQNHGSGYDPSSCLLLCHAL